MNLVLALGQIKNKIDRPQRLREDLKYNLIQISRKLHLLWVELTHIQKREANYETSASYCSGF